MNILLINTNPVVSRLISLCMREDNTVLEEVTEVSAVRLDSYDIIFVDDASCVSNGKQLFQNITSEKKVLLLGNNILEDLSENFNEVIKKPFLPSDIRSVIDTLNHTEEELEETVDAHFIFPLSTEEESEDELLKAEEEKEPEYDEEVSAQENSDTSKILDVNEIARIRSLLEEDDEDEKTVVPEEEYETRKREVITEHLEADGLEIVSEDEIINILSSKPEKTQKKKSKTDKKKKKEKKRSKKEKEASYTFEEALIAAIEGMKVKKIKKLLKDADIKISISFKDKK
jgi:hypothetical protein